jgi:hypothetical protein
MLRAARLFGSFLPRKEILAWSIVESKLRKPFSVSKFLAADGWAAIRR